MKTLLTVLLIAGLITCNTGCLSPAQKTEAKQLAVQVGTAVAKDAGIAAATTAVKLAQVTLNSANAKLAAQRTALDANPNASIKDDAKLSALEVAAEEAQNLLTAAQKQLAKLAAVDASPPPLTPMPTVITGVVVTPAP